MLARARSRGPMVVGGAMVGSLFSADAWNNITFTAGEIRNPRRNLPLSLALERNRHLALYAGQRGLCAGPARAGRPRWNARYGLRSANRGTEAAKKDDQAKAVSKEKDAFLMKEAARSIAALPMPATGASALRD